MLLRALESVCHSTSETRMAKRTIEVVLDALSEEYEPLALDRAAFGLRSCCSSSTPRRSAKS